MKFYLAAFLGIALLPTSLHADSSGPQFVLIQTDQASYFVGQKASVTITGLIQPANPNEEIAIVAKLAGTEQDITQLSSSQWATLTPTLTTAGTPDFEVDVYLEDAQAAASLNGTIAFYQQEICSLKGELSNEHDPGTIAAINAQILRDQGFIQDAKEQLASIRRPVEADYQPIAVTTPANAIAINAGGANYTGSGGANWSADELYSGGTPYSTTANIAGTPDSTLYQTVRYGNFTYTTPVSNGNYVVILKFAEIYFTSAHQRTFNVSINGTQVLSDFDIFAEARGADQALDEAFPVSVTNGQLGVQFTSVINNADVCAIEIVTATGASIQALARRPSDDSSTTFMLDADHSNRIYQESDIATFSLSLLTDFSNLGEPQEVVARGLVDGTSVEATQESTSLFSFSSAPFTDYQIGEDTFTGKVLIRPKARADSFRVAITAAGTQRAQDIAALQSTTDPDQQAYYHEQIETLSTFIDQYQDELEAMLTLVGTQTLDFTVTPSDRNIAQARTGAMQTIDIASQIASPSGSPLKITSITQPSRGSATLNPDGTVTYNPASDTSGSEQFRVIQADLGPGGAQPLLGTLLGVSLLPSSTSVATRPQVLFDSLAPNLSPENTTNQSYIYDVESGQLNAVVQTYSGAPPQAIAAVDSSSDNGRFLEFETTANNIVPQSANAAGNEEIYLEDRWSGALSLVSIGLDGNPANETAEWGELTLDGSWATFSSTGTNLSTLKTGGQEQVYERDLLKGVTKIISVDNSGNPGNGTSVLGTVSNHEGMGGRGMSQDGRYVTFWSTSTNFAPGLPGGSIYQVFVRDTQANTTSLVSVSSSGVMANGSTIGPQMSSDGRYAFFLSSATNLVPGNTAGCTSSGVCTWDLYVRDLQNGTTSRLLTGDDTNQVNNEGFWYFDNADNGRYVTFSSAATNILPLPSGAQGNYHCYLDDRNLGEVVELDVNSNGSPMSPATGSIPISAPVSSPGCFFSDVSADGLYAAVQEQSTNTISGNTGANLDIFVVTRTDEFTYTATDAQGNNVTGTVTLTEPMTGIPQSSPKNELLQ